MHRTENPYAAPNSDLVPDASSNPTGTPASRTKRFMAVFVDSAILLLLVILTLLFVDLVTGTDSLEEFLGASEDAPQLIELFEINLLNWATYTGLAIDAGMYLLINGYLLATRGQTIGKFLMGIAIVSVDAHQTLPLGRLVMLRYFPIYILQAFMFIVWFLVFVMDALLIFLPDRRTLHDVIAGTVVIERRFQNNQRDVQQ